MSQTKTLKDIQNLPGPTDEQVAQKVQELTESTGKKIHAFVFLLGGAERVAGYVREPDRMEKIQYLDRVATASASAAMVLLEACLIKEASDPRISSEDAQYDSLHLGAIQFIQNLMVMNYDVYKKK